MDESTPLLKSSPRFWANSLNRRVKSIAACLATFVVVLALIHTGTRYFEHPKKQYIVFFVTDGMGPASLSLTRSFRQRKFGLPFNDTLFLDKHLIGSSRTMSSSSLITDSAAGATAFSCAAKSYNGAIGVSPDKKPCGTILEALKLQGFLTGLVVTTRITDATPAAFSSHVDYRFQEDLIAQHQLGMYPLSRTVDLMLGGGRCHYHGCRADDRNLIQEAQNLGWTYAGDRKSFDALELGLNASVKLPLLGLFADTDIPYDLDRDASVYPSLEEETVTALNLLHKNSDKGFFLLVEGSRIDHGGHSNDPAAQVNEVLAFDKAFAAVAKFAEEHAHEADTYMVSTSDHETGGLSVAKQLTSEYPDYFWRPEILVNATKSSEWVTQQIGAHLDDPQLESLVRGYVVNDMGVGDVTDDEISAVLANKASPQDSLVSITNKRAQVGWSTHGHSAVDVNIYGFGSSEKVQHKIFESLHGNHENTDVGKFLASIVEGVELNKVTEMIKGTEHAPSKQEMASFAGVAPEDVKEEAILQKLSEQF